MRGGKATEETARCLQHSFQKRTINAERSVANSDGATLTYDLLMFLARECHSKNPKRCFKSSHLLSPETGHSRLEADSINKANDYTKKKSEFSTSSDQVEHINRCSELEA